MQDLSNNISPAVSIINAVKTAAANGTGVDLQGYERATVLVDVGAEGDTLALVTDFFAAFFCLVGAFAICSISIL